jgi:hypothetical protein
MPLRGNTLSPSGRRRRREGPSGPSRQGRLRAARVVQGILTSGRATDGALSWRGTPRTGSWWETSRELAGPRGAVYSRVRQGPEAPGGASPREAASEAQEGRRREAVSTAREERSGEAESP